MLSCPICGAPSASYYAHPEADLYQCTACGHAFADQRSLRAPVAYDESYGDEDHKNWFENPNTRLFEFIDRALGSEPDQSVLDVGCGRGSFLGFLAPRHPDWRLTGLEVTSFTPPPGMALVVGDFVDTEFATPFDATVSLAVIEHVVDPHRFVQKAIEVTRPAGLVILMTINTDSVLYASSRVLRRAGVVGPFEQLYSSHHLNHFNRASFADLVERNGLRVEGRFDCHIPASAIDFPPRGAVVDAVRKVGALGTFAVGEVLRRCYLQTLVARTPG
jgi:2-polyprenyl-3-methyl-5-hydroxy-6-metoxy-1,4-benzoquinol methylase